MGEERKLTRKQQRFVEEYCVDMNGTRAAVAAGYSKKCAKTIAAQNLSKRNIAKLVNRSLEDKAKETKLSVQYVLERLQIEANGTGPDTTPSARVAALNLLGKHMRMFEEEDKRSSNNQINIIISSQDEKVL